jgi:Lon-like ATP-dependent protease
MRLCSFLVIKKVDIRLNSLLTHLFAAALHRFAETGQVAALERTLSTMIRYFETRPEAFGAVLFHYAADSRWVLRYTAAREMYRLLPDMPDKVMDMWLQLADDHRLYVREGVAKGLVKAAEEDFDRVFAFCLHASAHASDRVRQTAAMPLIHWAAQPKLLLLLQPLIHKARTDSSTIVTSIFTTQIAPLLHDEELLPVQAKEYTTTAELPIPAKLIDQVVGQEEAVAAIRLAARQHRSVLLIGEPGTGKSMLGKAMGELLPASALQDVLMEAGHRESNVLPVRVVPAGEGERMMKEGMRDYQARVTSLRWVLGFASLVSLFVASFYAVTRDQPGYIIGGLIAVAFFYWFGTSQRGRPTGAIPKYLVNNAGKTHAPFVDGTGLHAGALLGDVRHDPYQSGGLAAFPHQLVEPGAIHFAHQGVLFIDEAAALSAESQQALLTAFQEKKMTITGRSPGSSGMMVRTEPVPSDFIMVLAGNVSDVDHLHPALRSRIRGYGYEIYMNDTMADTEENRYRLSLFIAQEIRKDGKIPHFTRAAADVIIECARQMADEPDRLTARFRELGGLIRAAGDLAVQSGAELVAAEHAERALQASKTLEEQMALRERRHAAFVEGPSSPGKLKTCSIYKNTIHQIVQVWADVQPSDGVEVHVSHAWTPKFNRLALEAALHRYRCPGKYFIEVDGAEQNHQPDDFALAMAAAAWSAKKGIVLPGDIAVCGSLNVAGEIGETPAFHRKAQAAKAAGIRTVIAPSANRDHSPLQAGKDTNLTIVWVNSLDEMLEVLQRNMDMTVVR